MSVQKLPPRYGTAHTAGGMCVPQIAAVIFVVVVIVVFVHGLFCFSQEGCSKLFFKSIFRQEQQIQQASERRFNPDFFFYLFIK